MSTDDICIHDARQLGAVVRAVRKAQSLRQDELGRISHSFIVDLENGKSTAQLGKVMEVLNELGVQLRLELPAGIDQAQFARHFHDTKDSR